MVYVLFTIDIIHCKESSRRNKGKESMLCLATVEPIYSELNNAIEDVSALFQTQKEERENEKN